MNKPAWWKSPIDNQVHGFDLDANLGKPEYTALCGHAVPRNAIIETHQGDWHRECLFALGKRIPPGQEWAM